jgi:hypothetical protein
VRSAPFGLALAAILAVAASARADEVATVVLLEPEQASPAAMETLTRAKSELGGAGFRVVVTTRHGADTRASLMTAMTEALAVAAIAIEPAEGSTVVEVWVSDGLTGKLSIRPIETAGRGDTPALLAIRAVELLRASLLELRNPPRGSSARTEAPEPIRRLTAEPGDDRATVSFRSGFGVEAGAAGLLGVSPASPAIAPVLRLSWGADMGLGARLSWTGPSAGPGVSGALGSATITQELLIAELVYAPPLDAPVAWLCTGGLGIFHVDASGELDDPRRQKSGGSTTLAVTAGTGLDLRVHEHLALSLEFFAGATAPAVVIDMGDEQVATLGQPLLGASLGVTGVF